MFRVRCCAVVAMVWMALGTQASAQPKLQAVKTDVPPKLDGSSDDAAWKTATELKLEAKGRGGEAKGKKAATTLKAAYDKDSVYFLLRWQDATKDETHKSFVWNDTKVA